MLQATISRGSGEFSTCLSSARVAISSRGTSSGTHPSSVYVRITVSYSSSLAWRGAASYFPSMWIACSR